jgi:CheY-like chemotaxis protein
MSNHVTEPRPPKSLELHLARAKVLVVDDQAHMRKLIGTMLKGAGIRFIQEAGNGVEALQRLAEAIPDVVLLDWDMPTMDGLEFLRKVRSSEENIADIPIIMLTAHGERWRVIEAARLGVHEYLVKPVSIKSLVERIGAVLLNPRAMRKVGQLRQAAGSADRQTNPPSTVEETSQAKLYV